MQAVDSLPFATIQLQVIWAILVRQMDVIVAYLLLVVFLDFLSNLAAKIKKSKLIRTHLNKLPASKFLIINSHTHTKKSAKCIYSFL